MKEQQYSSFHDRKLKQMHQKTDGSILLLGGWSRNKQQPLVLMNILELKAVYLAQLSPRCTKTSFFMFKWKIWLVSRT